MCCRDSGGQQSSLDKSDHSTQRERERKGEGREKERREVYRETQRVATQTNFQGISLASPSIHCRLCCIPFKHCHHSGFMITKIFVNNSLQQHSSHKCDLRNMSAINKCHIFDHVNDQPFGIIIITLVCGEAKLTWNLTILGGGGASSLSVSSDDEGEELDLGVSEVKV